MMPKRKIEKGTFGYLNNQKKRMIIRTISLFAISLAIFIMGYLTTKTKANLLTIVAMLGMLPASKSAVEMILFLRQQSGSDEIYQKIEAHATDLAIAYELVLTSYDKNFPISAIVVKANTVCGYSEQENCDIAAAEKHIAAILKQNALKPTVKIFKEIEKFTNRMDALKDLESENSEKDMDILEVIKAISI
ncbi:MAG: hypothetical protein PHS74_05895 [Lachnospiraceae bacterium]|nr:hypothetical protein [Lachnospiraceae bacterium]